MSLLALLPTRQYAKENNHTKYVNRTDSVELIQRLLRDFQRFVENTSSV